MRISDWSSDVCSSVLLRRVVLERKRIVRRGIAHAQHDHALRRAPQRLRAAPLIGAFRPPLHRAVTSLAPPLFEAARTQRTSAERRAGKGVVSKFSPRWTPTL